jgi:hypothetical protein
MKEALSSSETSVLTRAAWRNIPEDTIFQNVFHYNDTSSIFSAKRAPPLVYSPSIMTFTLLKYFSINGKAVYDCYSFYRKSARAKIYFG